MYSLPVLLKNFPLVLLPVVYRITKLLLNVQLKILHGRHKTKGNQICGLDSASQPLMQI